MLAQIVNFSIQLALAAGEIINLGNLHPACIRGRTNALTRLFLANERERTREEADERVFNPSFLLVSDNRLVHNPIVSIKNRTANFAHVLWNFEVSH